MPGGTTTSIRLAELVATLSLAADLGLGQPMQHCLQQTVIAMRLADRVGASESDVVATYYTIEGDPTTYNLFVEPDANQRWHVVAKYESE